MARPALELRSKAQVIWPGAMVVGRGRGHILHRHPTDPRRFMVDASLGPLHIAGTETEIDTAWQPDSGAWQWQMVLADFHVHARSVFNAGNIVEYRDPVSQNWVIFDPQSLNWINQDNSRQQIAVKQAVTGQVADDVLSFPAAWGAGRHFQYQCQTGRLQKLITIDSAANLPTPTVTGTVWLETEFSLSTSAGVDVYLDGVRWAKQNGVRVRTSNRIEFRDAATGQQVFWWLDFPRAWDSDGNETTGQMEVRRQGGASSLFITVRVPKTWIDTAVFPIFLDPTVDAQVGTDFDDALQSGTTPNLGGTNAWCRTSSNQWIAARAAITGPASGDTVDVAYVEWGINNGARDDAYGNVMCEAADNATQFTSGTNDLSGRTKTSTVAWAAANTGPNANDWATSPSMVTPVQEVIDRAGWASGNYINWFFNATDTGGTCSFQIWMYSGSTTLCSRIHVEYTAGGGSDMAGSAAGSATASAAVDAKGHGAGSAAGTATATVAAFAYGHAAGSADGLATATATIQGLRSGAGSADGAATASAAVDAQGHTAGSAAGAATAAASIQGLGDMAGSADGTSTAEALIEEAGGNDMAGSADGTSTAAASVTGVGTIAAASAGSATASVAALAYGQTAGSAAGTSTASAAIGGLADGDMSGAAAGVATAAAAITATGHTAGTAAGTAAASASIAGLLATAGSAAGSTTATAALGGTGHMAVSAAGLAVVAAAVVGEGYLVAVSAGSATAVVVIGGTLLPDFGDVTVADAAVYALALADRAVYEVSVGDELLTVLALAESSQPL